MIEINWNPKRKELRDFGIIALIASIILSILLYLLKHIAIHWILVIVGLGIFIFLSSLIYAKLTKKIYLGLVLLTFPIGLAVSFI